MDGSIIGAQKIEAQTTKNEENIRANHKIGFCECASFVFALIYSCVAHAFQVSFFFYRGTFYVFKSHCFSFLSILCM